MDDDSFAQAIANNLNQDEIFPQDNDDNHEHDKDEHQKELDVER